MLQTRLAHGDVPSRYAEAAWDRVRRPEGLKQYTEDLGDHAAHGRGLILTGPVGTGKSSMAGLVAQAAVMAGLSVVWQHVPSLLSLLLHGDRRDVANAFQRAVSPAVLVWDDFWLGEVQAWQMGHLDRVVEQRYSRHRPIVMTTNVPRKALESDESITRIMDRLGERTFWITVAGESMRKTWKDQG